MSVEVSAGIVATVRINRPEVHNALNRDVLSSIDRAVNELVRDQRTRAIVLTGTGPKAFSAGADLGELSGLDVEGAADTLAFGQRVLAGIAECPVPVICAVNGIALGGGFELVLACSISVLADNASLGLPEAGLGLIPGYGGTQRLARLVGKSAALYPMLTGDRITASRAFDLGLTPVAPVPFDSVLSTAHAIGESISKQGPNAIASILRLTAAGMDLPLDEALRQEVAAAAAAIASAEGAEGISAFTERRKPSFRRGGEASS